MGKKTLSKAWIATVVALCLLFSQLSVAAYACPELAKKSVSAAETDVVAMGNCESMSAGELDPAQPNLCKAHCESGQQLSKADSYTDLPSPVLNVLWTLVWFLQPVSQTASVVGSIAETSERPPGSPPFYLIHQVFRL